MATPETRQDYLSSLSSAQYAAATHPANGALSISAPPGSGKTRVLTSRVAWLVREQKIMPEEMIVVTFTNKAANEMRVRLRKLIGEDKTYRLVLGTFHALCARFLRRYGQLINLANNFSIMDADDSRKVLKEILGELKEHLQAENLQIKPETAQGTISWSKAKGVSPEAYRANIKKKADNSKSWRSNAEETSSYKAAMATVYEMYTQKLQEANALDFDDLLVFGVKLLKTHVNIVDNIRHVLVDEMQDTNTTQYQLMSLFASAQRHLTTVGDPDQSVYGWRAAELGNLERMSREFSTSTFMLEENYRSTKRILEAALRVIEQDHQRVQKGLFTSHPSGPPVTLKKAASPTYEARFIATEIKRVIAHSGGMLDYNDFVVLLRYNALSREIEQALQAESIPSRMVGGSKFFERMEVKDILAYLQLVVNPSYTPAFSRVLNVPKRGIGDKSLKDFVAQSDEMHMTPMELAELVVNPQQAARAGSTSSKGKSGKSKKAATPNNYGVKPAMIKGLTALVSAVQEMRRLAANDATVEQLIDFILDNVDYKTHLAKEQDVDARMENVKELVNFAQIVVQAAQAMPHLRESGRLRDLAVFAGEQPSDESGDESAPKAKTKREPEEADDSDAEAVDVDANDEYDEESRLQSQRSDTKPRKPAPPSSSSSLLDEVEAVAVKTEHRMSASQTDKKRKKGDSEQSGKDVIEISDSDSNNAEEAPPKKRRSHGKAAQSSASTSAAALDSSDDNDLQASDVPSDSPLRLFLEACTLSTDVQGSDGGNDPAKDGPKVTISTCHAAKGLEYPVVFVAGVEDGIFPFFRCEKQHEIDEERRLLYVAMTRAQGLLYLTWNAERMMRGEFMPKDLSRFIIPIATRAFGGIAPPAVKKSVKEEAGSSSAGKGAAKAVGWSAGRPEITDEVRDALATVLERSKISTEQAHARIEEFEGTRTADAIRQPEPRSVGRGGSYGGYSSYGNYGGFGDEGGGFSYGSAFGNGGYGGVGRYNSGSNSRSLSTASQSAESGPIMGRTGNSAGFSSALKQFGRTGSGSQAVEGSALDRKPKKGCLGPMRSGSSGSQPGSQSSRTILTPYGLSKDEGSDLYSYEEEQEKRNANSSSAAAGPAPATKVPTSNYSGFYKNPALENAEDESEGKSKVGLDTFTSDHKKTLDALKSFGGGAEVQTDQGKPYDAMAPMPPRAFGQAPKVGGTARRGSGKTLGMRRK